MLNTEESFPIAPFKAPCAFSVSKLYVSKAPFNEEYVWLGLINDTNASAIVSRLIGAVSKNGMPEDVSVFSLGFTIVSMRLTKFSYSDTVSYLVVAGLN